MFARQGSYSSFTSNFKLVGGSGGLAVYKSGMTWSTLGTWPAGLTMSAAGVISGTPTAATSSPTGTTVSVQAVDANGCAVTQDISIKVNPIINLSPTTLPDATAGISYATTGTPQASASGGASPYTYSLVGGAPSWLAINASSGQLSGTPLAAAASVVFSVTATDANGSTGTRGFLINVAGNSDYGDFSGFAGASSLMTTDIHLGALVDAETGTNVNATASGDDTTGQADDDGVILPSVMLKGNTATVTVNVTNTSGAPAYLNGWIDFNNNGVLTDSGEQIIVSLSVPSGTVGGSISVLVSVPAGAATGNVGARFRLTSTAAPGATGASGYGEVEDYLANIQPPLSLGNLVWYDANNNGVKDASEIGISGLGLQLFASGKNPLVDAPLATTTTSAAGAYLFSNLAPGQYFVYIPTPSPLYPVSSTTRANTDNGVDNDNNGSQTAKGQPVTSPIITLSPGTESVTDGDADANTDLTVDFGFTACLAIGSTVWNDSNNNGIRDAGETGIGGVTVHLFNAGPDNLANTADDSPVGNTVTTTITGAYLFNNLIEGNYYVRVTPSAAYPVTSGTPATTDNDVDNNNDGSQPGGPGTPLYSPVITLTPGGESIADGDADANTNLTIDFGLFTGFTIGNLVWYDANNNGVRDAGEAGISGLTVELLNSASASFSPAITTTTNSVGAYGFTVYQPGTYKIKVPPSASYPRASSSLGIDNGTDNNNDGSQPGGSGTASISFPFTLAGGAEPGTLAQGNAENTIDFGFTLCPPIVISPSTLPAPVMATAYNQVLTASGGTMPYSWAVANGSLPSGLSLSPYTTADVGVGTSYSSIFTPASTVTVNPPDAIIGISLGGTAGPTTSGIWSLKATGGVSISILGLGITETGAQVELTGSALKFNMSNNTSSLLGALGVGTSIAATWEAAAKYNTAGSVLNLQPNTRYTVSFFVDGSNGLLKSGLGIVPSFTTELLDGAGNAVAEKNSGTLINLVGLLGTGVTSGTVNLTFDTPSTVAAGAYSLRFKGGAVLNTTVLGLGRTFATISNVTVNTLSLDRERLSGTPTMCGSSAFTIQATDATGCVGSQAYTMAVTGTFTLVPATLPDATTGANYSATSGTQISTAGGTAPFLYTLAAGAPSWLSINSSTGQLSGTPTASATGVAFTVNALDATSCTGSRAYVINVTGSSDFGDYSRFGSASSTVNTAIRMGAQVDAENIATTNLTATGDDFTGLADEDGVTLPSVMLKGTNATVTVNVTNTSGAPAYLNGWIDFNNNGVLTDAGEQIATNQVVATGTSGGTVSLTVNVPAGASTGSVGVRFRLTSTSSPGSVGASGTGEVEDYLVNIQPPMSIGNLVWNDVNNNGIKDAGESGLMNASVRLYTTGADNLIGTADDVQIGSTQTTTSTGAYLFSGLAPGSYFVRVTPPASIYLTGGTPVTLDNGSDNDNNGSQPGGAGSYCYSPLITLAAATEPTIEDGDNNTDLSVDFGLWSGFTVGDLVWDDQNNDGIRQAGEPGLAGITVQLMSPGTDNAVGGTGPAADTLIQTTTTTSAGAYSFYVTQPGNYYVRVFPTTGHELASAPVTTTDNGVNDDNNGSQPGGMNTVVNSMIFTLAAGTEPGGSGTGNNELSIDFGLRPCPVITISPAILANAVVRTAYSATLSASGSTGALTWALTNGSLPAGLSLNASTGIINGIAPTTTGSATFTVQVTDSLNCSATKTYTINVIALSIGNLVWNDLNGNGLRDAGEPGVAGAVIKLFSPGADGLPYTADDVQIGSTLTTGSDGAYLFNNLTAGNYWVQCTPVATLPLTSGNVVAADNGIDNDNNGSQPSGAGTALRSPPITLTAGAEPTSEDGDNNSDLTVDFALFQGMSMGDLVWNDLNDNGHRDVGEPGIAGVTVQLFSPGSDGKVGGSDDVLVGTTTTDGSGAYLFSSLTPGKYYLRLPVLPATTPLASSVVSFADNGIDNDSNGLQTGTDPVYSPIITLAPLTEPGSTNADLTIDFGLTGSSLGAFATAANDDGVQVYDPSTGGFSSMFQHPFGNSNSQGNGDTGDVPWGIEHGPDGNWYVSHLGAGNIRKISAAGVDQGLALSTLPGISQLAKFTFGPDGNFYVLDPNGSRVIRYAGPLSTSQAPGTPLDAAPYNFIAKSARDIAFGPDSNLYLLVKSGTSYQVERYNAVTGAFMNTIVTAAQVGSMVAGGSTTPVISGIDIHNTTLYGVTTGEGEVFQLSLADPASPGTPQLIADLDNSNLGSVDTEDLKMNPANGQLYVCGYRWVKTVKDGSILSSALIKVSAAGAVTFCEAVMPTAPGPANETFPGIRDVAFGSRTALPAAICSIGSTAWNDVNFDGQYQPGEPALPNVKIELWRDANNDLGDGAEQLTGWTYSDAYGHYFFDGLAPGNYQVVVAASNFSTGGALVGFGPGNPSSSGTDNQVDGDNNGLPSASHAGAFSSPIITLAASAEPTGNGTSGVESGVGGDLDDLLGDSSGDMTVDFAFTAPGSMAIGNLIFQDINGNGHYDDGEGVDGIKVELYTGGQTPGVNAPLRSTVTSNGGRYLFTSLAAGTYVVFVPASEFGATGILRGMFSLPGARTTGDDDIGEKGIDSASPEITGIQSAPVVMALHSVPTATSGETGFDSASDDADDDNSNLTIDFGFYTRLGVGNLVFIDANGNGRAEPSEGVNGVTVQLYTASQTPEVDIPIATTVTANGGLYLFSDLMPGYYRVHIPASMFQAGKPLVGLSSMSDGRYGDDDVGEDGLNDTVPALQGVSSSEVLLMAGTAPTSQNGETGIGSASDDAIDAAIDLTVDFGFQHSMTIGNLVFFDANGNGHYDTGEGVGGVRVELYASGSIAEFDLPMLSTTTASNGHYLFSSILAGSYFVHIPSSQFQNGQPLYNKVSMTGVAASGTDDSVGEKGLDSPTPSYTGISTADVMLTPGSAPVDSLSGSASGENGFMANEDNANDADGDLTIDLGFTVPGTNKVGVGNAVFSDLNGNGHYDDGEGVGGVTLRLYASTTTTPGDTNMLATATTDAGGGYYFGGLNAGKYFIVIPGTNFSGTGKLTGQLSLPGQGGDDGIDDDADENGDDPPVPASSGVRSVVFNLQPGLMPTDFDTEFGKDTYIDDAQDANTNLTIDFGFYTPVGIGNLVFLDANGNGKADVSEGVGGVTVQLFKAGSDYVTDAPVASQVTSTATASKGSYMFTGLLPGSYYLHIPSTMFAAGAPLAGTVSMTGAQSTGGDDDTGEDGIDPTDIVAQGISTGIATLVPGTAPTGTQENGLFANADDVQAYGDGNYDLTWDFGFVNKLRVGNLVFRDNNADGKYTAGTDAGVPGVTVQFYRQDTGVPAVLIASTTTDAAGRYRFDGPPGSYFVEIPASMFVSGGPLVNTLATSLGTVGDDNVGQDATDNGNPLTDGARTAVFQLAAGTMPTAATGETGFDAASDDALDAYGNLTIDLGFKGAPSTAPLSGRVRRDLSSSGIATSETPPLAGVELALYSDSNSNGVIDTNELSALQTTVSGSDGTYAFNSLAQGAYVVVQTPLPGAVAMAATGGTLPDRTAVKVTGSSSVTGIDFMQCLAADTFAQWQMQNGVGGANDNPHGGLYDNLLSYALCIAPTGGQSPLQLAFTGDGTVDASFVRPITGRLDVRYKLEVSSDLSHWSVLTTAPVSAPNADGTERIRFAGITLPFIRLRVDLDADHNGVAEATSVSPVMSWSQRLVSPALQTFSMPLLKPSVFAGRVEEATSSDFIKGRQYYAEAISGDLEGQRWEVDELHSSASSLAFDATAPPSGTRVTVRAHWTVLDLFPTSLFHPGTSASNADRVLFFDGTGYRVLWLLSRPTGSRWVRDGDATLTDAGGGILSPAEGVMIQPRTESVTLPLIGEVRAWKFSLPLRAGAQLVGSGYPLDLSPADRAMSSSGGFSITDSFRLWQGDMGSGSAYSVFSLQNASPSMSFWASETGNDVTRLPVFTSGRAAFVVLQSNISSWQQPCPWRP